jgi:hypothetical protein
MEGQTEANRRIFATLVANVHKNEYTWVKNMLLEYASVIIIHCITKKERNSKNNANTTANYIKIIMRNMHLQFSSIQVTAINNLDLQ